MPRDQRAARPQALELREWRTLAKKDAAAAGRLVVRVPGLLVPAPEAKAVAFTLSDDSVDRYGDTINAAGWKLERYAANPVVLWAHDGDEPAIGRGVNVRVEGNALKGAVEFAASERHQQARLIEDLVAEGVLRAVSVGFLPLKWQWVETPERYGIDFIEQELVEFSVCNVPANANCLIEPDAGDGGEPPAPMEADKAAAAARIRKAAALAAKLKLLRRRAAV